jgi:hypothetical protein
MTAEETNMTGKTTENSRQAGVHPQTEAAAKSSSPRGNETVEDDLLCQSEVKKKATG